MFLLMMLEVNFDGRFVFLEGEKRPPGLLPLVEILVSRHLVAFVGCCCCFDEGADFFFPCLVAVWVYVCSFAVAFVVTVSKE